MGRRRRRAGRRSEELTLEGFGDPREAPAVEPAVPQEEPAAGSAPAKEEPAAAPAGADEQPAIEPAAAHEAPATAPATSLEEPIEPPGAPAAPPEQPAIEPATTPGGPREEPEPLPEDPGPSAGDPVAGSGAGGGEEGDYTPSFSAPAGEGEGGVDLPDDPGVLERSISSTGETRDEDDGPELATGFSLQEPVGPLSETPVQDAPALPSRYPADPPAPVPDPGTSPLDDLENARALVGQGRINSALILLRNTVQADPRNVDARVELGVLLDRTGSHAAAVEHLEAALRGAPDNVQILSALGAAQTSLGRFDEAERELKKAQRLAPEDLLVRAHLAIVSFRRGLYALAEAELRWVCERDEGNATAHFYRGEALNRLGRVDEALDAMKTVTRLDPGNSRAFYTMGILYDKKHLPTEAAAMYRRARELAPR